MRRVACVGRKMTEQNKEKVICQIKSNKNKVKKDDVCGTSEAGDVWLG